jgi:predicted Zn finger-like uncharacterized protein
MPITALSRHHPPPMIIACPRCATSYEVEAAAFGRRARRVQCSACACAWTQAAENADDAHPPAAGGSAEAAARGSTEAAAGGSADAAEAFDHAERIESPKAANPAPDLLPETPPAAEARSAEPAADAQLPHLGQPGPPAGTDQAAPGESGGDAPAEADADTGTIPATPAGEADTGETGAGTCTVAADGRPRGAWLSRRRVLTAGATAAGTVLIFCALLIVLREPIVAALPAFAGVFGAVGLAPDPLGEGLEIRDVASAREHRGGEDQLVITGAVVNVDSRSAPLPALRVSLWDGADTELRTLVLADRPSALAQGERWTFTATLPGPPPDAKRIRVGFTETGR